MTDEARKSIDKLADHPRFGCHDPNCIHHAAVIKSTPDRRCELCGKEAELRPYGPHGERVCFACGMLDEEACKRAFSAKVMGEHIA